MKCQLKPIPVSMTDEELSLPWQQKNGICLLCCVCISLQVSSRLSVLLAGNVNIGMKTIDYDLFELRRHTVMLMKVFFAKFGDVTFLGAAKTSNPQKFSPRSRIFHKFAKVFSLLIRC